jgi:hypothetical protein
MANVDAPNGLWPRRYLSGAPWNGKAGMYFIPDTDSDGNYGIGDVVKLAGSADANGVMTVTGNCASTQVFCGVIIAVVPVTSESTLYRADDTARYVLVADDPNLLFSIQEDSVSADFAAIDTGRNAVLTGFKTPNTTTGYSILELDSSTASATTAADVALYGLDRYPGNAFGANARWLVRLNNHQFVNATTGI